MLAELVNGVITCPKCHSPMNIDKARRRFVKRSGREEQWEREYHWGKQVVIGYCACGEYVFQHINK